MDGQGPEQHLYCRRSGRELRVKAWQHDIMKASLRRARIHTSDKQHLSIFVLIHLLYCVTEMMF